MFYCNIYLNDSVPMITTILEFKNYIAEVKYLYSPEIIKDSDTVRVYHGFNRFSDVENVLKTGLSGKENARRIYSYESGNNPYGLFVTVNFEKIKRGGFAHSGVIIEFTSKISDLEAPVWVGGRSYFVQGEYTKSFKDLDEREQQRLINRQKEGQSPYDYISKSDRPELAATIFDNPENQALYVGDLNPNMIKYVWYNEILHKNRKTNGEWVKYTRKDFVKKLNIDTKNDRYLKYLPNDDFDFDEFVKTYYDGDYNDSDLLYFLRRLDRPSIEYDLKNMGFFPKQIRQLVQLKNKFKNNDNTITSEL